MSDMMRPSEEELRIANLVAERVRGSSTTVPVPMFSLSAETVRRIVREENEKLLADIKNLLQVSFTQQLTRIKRIT